MKLYFIQCRFKLTKTSEFITGFAICSSPDDVVTFIYPDGKPVSAPDMWEYSLHHLCPWVMLEIS